MSLRYHVDFGSTDDPDLDSELARIEDTPWTLAEISAICQSYQVRANVFDDADFAGAVDPEGTWTPHSEPLRPNL